VQARVKTQKGRFCIGKSVSEALADSIQLFKSLSCVSFTFIICDLPSINFCKVFIVES